MVKRLDFIGSSRGCLKAFPEEVEEDYRQIMSEVNNNESKRKNS